MVNHAISTVETNLLEGALIVVFILVLFLGNFRAGLLVASVIPLSMLIAIILMNTFGVSGNLMSLGALDFGLIVDGAVIIVEAVLHQIAHNRKLSGTLMLNTEQMDHQVSTSAKKMMNSAVFGQIIILIVYLPIFTLEGIEGKMFKPMAQTVAFALLGAFLLSITYIPMMSAWVLSKKVHHSPNLSDRAMAWLEQRYRSSLIRILHFPKLVLAAVLILFAASVFILSRLGGEFIPSLEEGDFAVDTRVLTGSNLNTTIEYTQKCAAIIKDKFPEVEKVVTKIGSGEVPTDPMPMEASDMMVILKDKKEWTSARNFPELAEKMSEALKVVPGVTTGFQYPVQMRFNELMTGARQDVVCKIFGEDLDSLAALAARLGSVIQTVSGAEDLYLEPVTGLSQIIVDYDRNQLALFRVSVEEVNRCVNTAFAGQSAGLIFEGEKRFDLVVRLDTTVRNKLEDIHNLLIPLPGGNQVPLRQLAKVSLREGPNQIQREDAKRRIVVGFNVRGRDVQSIVEEVQQKVEKNMDLPTGYYITYGGAFENLRQAKARLGIAVPISLVLIFVLLFFAFGSVRQGLIIYTAIPLSAIGGIYFLAIRGLPFSISAGVGFIALFGVAVLNGIVLISEFNRQKESGIHNLPRIVIRATSLRLRPVLMTAMVASMGFLPMAISQGAGAEVQRPLATVVIGGLIIATFLTLYVLPILYMMTERKKHKFKMDASKLALLLPFVLLSWDLPAQTKTLSWKAAVDSAIQNNLGIKNKLLIEEYRAYMTHTAWLIPPTSFSLEAGQLNSAFFDNRIAITQSMEMPRAYRNRKELLKEEWTDAQISTALTESELKKWVTDLFFNLILQQEEYAILLAADSLNQKILDRAQLRVQEGESALLEQTNASLQSRKLKVEAARLMTEIESTRLKLKQILNIKEDFTPEHQGLLIPLMASAETKTLDKHPEIRSLESGLRMAQNLTAIERSALLPEWQAGYYNQSIRGTGADDVRYDAGARFQAFQIGLAVPLISKAQRNKIRGAEKRSFAAEVALEQRKKELGTELESAWLRYKIKSDALATLDQGQIEDARKLAETASILYDKGEINYVEFSLLVQQSLQVRREYLNAVKDLNNEINLIHYLNSK